MIEFEKFTRLRFHDYMSVRYGGEGAYVGKITQEDYFKQFDEWFNLNYKLIKKDFEEYLKTFEVKPPY